MFSITSAFTVETATGVFLSIANEVAVIIISSNDSAEGFKEIVPKLAFPLNVTDVVPYPTNETSNVPLVKEVTKVKLPSKSDVFPVLVPLTIKEAPGSG